MLSIFSHDPVALDSRRSRVLGVLAIALPLLLFIPLIPLTSGNTSAKQFVLALFDYARLPAPGYPLYWLLGVLWARLDLGVSHFNVALMCSALPVALSSWVLYRASRHMDVHPYIALFASLVWATGPATLALATQAHVHALSALFASALFYMSLRYIKDPGEPKWLFRFAAVAALASAHQIFFFGAWTSLLLMIVLTEWRILTRWKIVLGFLAASTITPILFFIVAWLTGPDASPPSIAELVDLSIRQDRLLSHMDERHLGPGLIAFWRQWFLQMFPGAPLLAIAGLWRMTGKSWPRRWALVALSLLSPPITLLLLSNHPETDEFVAALLAPLCVLTALGLQALVELEVWHRDRRWKIAAHLIVLLALGLVGAHVHRAIGGLL